MNNDEILKLAKECGCHPCTIVSSTELVYPTHESIEAFYRAAYNKAIEEAYHTARSSGISLDGVALTATQVISLYDQICNPIRALEMKP